MKHELIQSLPLLLLMVSVVAWYVQIVLIAKRMRDELRRRDAEGCQHGRGPDGKRRTSQPFAHECDDCGWATWWWIDKGDHHGGTKRVCEDRTVCHQRSPR